MSKTLDTYLREVEARLQRLPPSDKAAEVEEIRLHLEALAEAQRELGQGDEAAYQAAVAHFGGAAWVGKSISRAWARRQRGPRRRALLAACAYTWGGLILVSITQRIALWTPWGFRVEIAGLLGALLVGFATGKLAPQRAWSGVLLAWGILTAVATTAMWLVAGAYPPDVQERLGGLRALSLAHQAVCAGCSLLGVWLARRRDAARPDAVA